jgi:hypothetical protein
MSLDVSEENITPISTAENQPSNNPDFRNCLTACFTLSFDLEDGHNVSIRNVGLHWTTG